MPWYNQRMKKILTLSVFVAVFIIGVATVARAETNTFVHDLQVGSEGSEVSMLQTWLISKGFDIPSITSGKLQKGYFGSQTKAAVRKYQTSVKLPSTGFFGPQTRASISKTNITVTPSQPVTPASPNVITTPGVAGTLAVTLQGSPSGASLDKGETESVVRYKLQAAASDMQVTSIALDFDVRLWLYAGGITIKDDAGNVVVQKNNLSGADFSELTTASSYRLNLPTNYIVPRSQSRYLTVSLSMLGMSDRSSGTVTIGQIQVRSIDGVGVASTETSGDDRTFTYTGGNANQIVMTLNNQSPPNMLVPISSSGQTENVVMGVANFKSQNRDGVLRKMSIYIATNGQAPADVFDDVKIQSGNYSYSADSIKNGNNFAEATVFNNMAIPLPKDQDVPIAIVFTVKKNVNNALNGVMASSTLVGSGTAGGTSNNPVVEDSNSNTIDINDANLLTSDLTFSGSDANLFSAAPTATVSEGIIGNINGISGTVSKNVSFTYTLTAGNDPLYVSANPVAALSTTSTGYASAANASSTITSVTATPSEVAGDSAGTYFIVPAGGSRTFRWTGTVRYDAPRGSVLRTFGITGIKYGTTSSNLTANTVVYYDYGALKISTVI
jgi:peptidoglycan hydrolase-like protein with peptidoglycan-binding domain